MNSRWGNNLRKRMADHQEPSPDGLWDDIEQVVKEKQRKSTYRRERKAIWVRRISASAAAAILFLLGYHFYDKTQSSTQLVVGESLKGQNDLKADVATKKADNEMEYIENKDSQYVWKKKKEADHTTKNTFAEASEVDSLTNEELDHYSGNENSQPSSDKKAQPVKKTIAQQEKEENSLPSLPRIIKNTRTNNWDVNLYASNIPANSSDNHNGYQSFGTEAPLSSEHLEDFDLGDDPYTDVLFCNKYKETYTNIKHKQPLTVGLSLRYNLDKKWGLESGLTYTMLSSDLHSGSSNHYYTSKQTLHYIGIPLKISYNIWENKRFSIYSTAGGRVEKCVSGKLVTDYVINNKKESSKNEKISISQPQWSLNGSVGGQFKLSEKIGIYVEPGINYYFKDGSEIKTIYKEKPVNFNLQLGFRVILD